MSKAPYLRTAIARYADRQAPGARTSAIARTRLIDDLLSEAVREGLNQAVILGAGFDCRFYRLPDLSSVAAFEVDHPATVAAKVSVLRALLGKVPPGVRFIDIDFDRQDLAETMRLGGFDSVQPTIFIWEGVTNYLTASAVDAVLRYVAGCASGSRLVFTYVHRAAMDGAGRFPDAAKIIDNVNRLGEPWRFGLIPEELPSYLRERGLRLNRDEDARRYRHLYFGADADSMSGYDFYHVAVASVASAGKAID